MNLPRVTVRLPLTRVVWTAWSAILLVGCGEAGLDPEEIPDVQGSWNYTESLTSPSSVTCDRVGTIVFEQREEVLIGTYLRSGSCSGPSTAAPAGLESGAIESGRALGDRVEFSIGACQYQGSTDTRNGVARILGTVLCQAPSRSAPGTLDAQAGSWIAERITEERES